jgi:hypothetical protein
MDFNRILDEMLRARPQIADLPAMIAQFDRRDIGALGETYLARIRPAAKGAKRLTDKLPGNFLVVGLIALALPGAKIIHAMRDPVDTCLSCFTKLFDAPLTYTYDLGTLGRFYRGYHAMMTHWRGLLPPGVMLEVPYENVVAGLESEARRIVEFCGLPWDDRCLSFHETRRMVRTASVSQVREKIYSRAVGRWRRYEKHLGPLLDALGDLGPIGQDDQSHA